MSGHAAALLLFEIGVGAMGLSGCHHLFQDRSLFLTHERNGAPFYCNVLRAFPSIIE
jgi:hypothetical protein